MTNIITPKYLAYFSSIGLGVPSLLFDSFFPPKHTKLPTTFNCLPEGTTCTNAAEVTKQLLHSSLTCLHMTTAQNTRV